MFRLISGPFALSIDDSANERRGACAVLTNNIVVSGQVFCFDEQGRLLCISDDINAYKADSQNPAAAIRAAVETLFRHRSSSTSDHLLCLDVEGASKKISARIVVWTKKEKVSPNQQFCIDEEGYVDFNVQFSSFCSLSPSLNC